MIVFKRIKQQNFYVAKINKDYELLKSYNTIVGLLDKQANICYAVKYSRTTSKQSSQYFNNYTRSGDICPVTASDLRLIIRNATGCDLDTRYNMQYCNSIL